MANIVDILDFLWGIPLTLFIIVAGLYFSKCINFIQFKNPKLIIKNTIGKIKNNNSYRTITSVLGGTIGSGNIAGIATAIAIGGPGAVFWMWFVAFLSMATKMVEVTLAVHYQKKYDNNNIGGAMYYISSIKGKIGKVLAILYSVALLIYVLCDAGFVQINTVSTALIDTFNIKPFYLGIILFIISFIVIKGGLKRVSNLLEKMVPIMCGLYIIISLIVIIINYQNIPNALINIFKYAFKPAPIIGGFTGSTIIQAISKGASRGIFANEAGTGTSTTVHATTSNKAIDQGMWGIVEVYIVSFVICTITAFLVLTTNSWTTGLDGAPMVLNAYQGVFGNFGKYILCIMISLFAYTTYIGFYYEYTTCIKYILNDKFYNILKWIYLFPIFMAVYMPISSIWTFADISVGFIVIPNIIALLILSKQFKVLFEKSKIKKIRC